MNVYIVIPVRNRCHITLQCLSVLSPLCQQGFSIVVVDDGSTDSTPESIKEEFPNVTLIKGDGDLFWTGAIEKGMRYAIASEADCCIIVNDDCAFDASSFKVLAEQALEYDAIVSGQGKIERHGGGYLYFPKLYKGAFTFVMNYYRRLDGNLVSVDACRGNLVAIPKSIINKIGLPDGSRVPHMGGDTDYTLRATENGFDCYINENVEFIEKEVCRGDNSSWLLGDYGIKWHAANLFSKRGTLYPTLWYSYYWRHWKILGLCGVLSKVIKLFVTAWIRAVIPKSVLRRQLGSHSNAYNMHIEIGSSEN